MGLCREEFRHGLVRGEGGVVLEFLNGGNSREVCQVQGLDTVKNRLSPRTSKTRLTSRQLRFQVLHGSRRVIFCLPIRQPKRPELLTVIWVSFTLAYLANRLNSCGL